MMKAKIGGYIDIVTSSWEKKTHINWHLEQAL
jgi:hypothetical protein